MCGVGALLWRLGGVLVRFSRSAVLGHDCTTRINRLYAVYSTSILWLSRRWVQTVLWLGIEIVNGIRIFPAITDS